MSSNQRYQRRAIDEAIDRAVGEMMELALRDAGLLSAAMR